MLSGFLQCCNSHNEAGAVAELRVVHLSSDTDFPHHAPAHPDAVDWTSGAPVGPGPRSESLDASFGSTPRQRSFQERIRLPRLRRYPVPPGCSSDDPEEVRREELQRTYREFVIDLHRGIHVTQLTSTQDYSTIHCQILEDLQTLKVDQGSGEIIEFPLGAVSKVYRIVKNDEKFNGAFGAGSTLLRAEHIVVVEFMRRKLAFVFHEIQVAQRFLMCIELLIRRAQEFQAEGGALPHAAGGSGGGGGGIAPIFASFGGAGSKAREGGERMGKPLLPLDVVRPGGGGGAIGGRQSGGGGGLSPCG